MKTAILELTAKSPRMEFQGVKALLKQDYGLNLAKYMITLG